MAEYSSEKYETQHEVKSYYRFLIGVTLEAGESLNQYRTTGKLEHQTEFKNKVDAVTYFYFNKFSKADNVEKPEILDVDDIPNMTEASFNDCKEVYFQILKLQEELGHTSLESLKRGRRQV